MKLHHNIEASHGSNCKNLVQNHNTAIKIPSARRSYVFSARLHLFLYVWYLYKAFMCRK